MFKEDEIDNLKKNLGADGKLIISDDLTEKQKSRYQFINSLNIDLISVLTRNTKPVDFGDEEANAFSSVESGIQIEEDENATIDGLDEFF